MAKRQTGKPRDRWEDSKLDVMETQSELHSIGLGLGQVLGFSELNNEFHKNREFFVQRSDHQPLTGSTMGGLVHNGLSLIKTCRDLLQHSGELCLGITT
jgi:hypothetical protein